MITGALEVCLAVIIPVLLTLFRLHSVSAAQHSAWAALDHLAPKSPSLGRSPALAALKSGRARLPFKTSQNLLV